MLSIVEQDLPGVEVILSDAASTDGTLDVFNRVLTEHHIPFSIIIQPGSTIYGAMNLGIQIARGEWLYFMGSDDKFISPSVLRKLLPLFLSSQHSVIYGDVWIRALQRRWGNGRYSSRSLARWNIPHQATFYRRSILKSYALMFNEKFSIEADWDLNLQLWKHVRFHYVDLLIADYSGDGTSSKSTSFPLYDRLAERLLDIYGLTAFQFLPSYRFADACRSHPNSLYRFAFTSVRFCEAIARRIKYILF